MHVLPIASLFARTFAAILIVALVVAAEKVQAGVIAVEQIPSISVRIGDETEGWDYTAPKDAYRSGKVGDFALESSRVFDNILDGRASIEVRELAFDPNPFVLNNILVTNNTGVTQTFTATVTLPTVFGAPNLVSGDVRTSVIDGGSDGAALATTGPLPVYQAQIDGATVAMLQVDPFSVVAPAGGSNTLASTFGPSANGVAVTTDIGIVLRFTLTAGDTAAILSRFDVEAVPEPAAFVLGLIGLVAISIAKRRQRLR